MAETLKAFKFRVYPTPEQAILLNKTFGCARFVWNKLTEGFNSWGPNTKPEVINEKTLKDNPEYPWLNEVSAAVLQQKRIDFDETKKQFFNKSRKVKIGRPSFKKKGNRQSFRLPNQKFSLNQTNSTVRLEKIGHVKVTIDREIPEEANYRSVTVSKDPSGKFYASVLVQINIDLKPTTGRRVGIDLGLKDLFILSDGEVIDNPKFFRDNQAKLKLAQQHLSRKQKGSNRRFKQKIKVAKVHERIRNRRNNFLHEVSSAIVRDFDVICIEDLNVKGMIKNHCLAKEIADASWSIFTTMLDYKCTWYGKTLVQIDRFYPSSKTCSCCGHKLDHLDLGTREWTCPECGTHHDRDLNAAINIERKGFADLVGEELKFDGFPKPSSVESIEYKRGEELSLFGASHHLASSLKRLVNL